MRIKPMKQRLMIIIGFVLLCLQILKAQEKVNIWQGTACRKDVEMTAYLAKGGSKMAVIVCPGGSYLWHDMNGEGHEVAKWLQNNGISAFVLHYRTAGFMAFFLHYRQLFRGVRYPDALDDLIYKGTRKGIRSLLRQHWSDGLFCRRSSCTVGSYPASTSPDVCCPHLSGRYHERKIRSQAVAQSLVGRQPQKQQTASRLPVC